MPTLCYSPIADIRSSCKVRYRSQPTVAYNVFPFLCGVRRGEVSPLARLFLTSSFCNITIILDTENLNNKESENFCRNGLQGFNGHLKHGLKHAKHDDVNN